ncbi:hypothetical protein [Hansschlegelia beijingensis]|uniref:Uncharacterized protein n=1 Tax=Hansschlegelia beijingensis TaxID=1133344 RepID=A0A7W6CW84_9HYPH|nr:hypothetical protein [Hansschlegelia beijingensis]MBB3971514.1 hypothetical protein [Hansschlegelia beijingensis]
MAYVSQGQYRAYHLDRRSLSSSPAGSGLLARSALVAVAAGAVIVALSGAGMSRHEVASGAAAKGDRLAGAPIRMASVATEGGRLSGGAEIRRDAAGRVVYMNDPAGQVTTVARNATVPLTRHSPLDDAGK